MSHIVHSCACDHSFLVIASASLQEEPKFKTSNRLDAPPTLFNPIHNSVPEKQILEPPTLSYRLTYLINKKETTNTS